VTPAFKDGKGVGWFANTCHAMDIGGRTLGAGARQVYEEGVNVPIMYLFRQGVLNQDLIDILRANVREPDQVVGDLYAQQAGNDVGAAKLLETMVEYDLDTLDLLSQMILDRSEEATRDAIEEIPNGRYEDEVPIDGFDDPLVIKVAIDVGDRDLVVDYTGSSPQVNWGINVVYNYTHAYTTYPLKCAISPAIPNNEGSFRPVTVKAPEGCILNAQFPCAVGARHLVGHFLSQAVFGALSKAVPDRVLADGSAGLWNTQLEGIGRDGRRFAYIFFSAGGMGASPTDDGLSATAFPSGIRGVPAEAIESVSPVRMLKRELIQDSGGAGEFRGGLSQEMVLTVDSDSSAQHSCMYDRTRFAPRGFLGGQDGMRGELYLSDGTAVPPKATYDLASGDTVTLRLPGGGGYGRADLRDPERVLEDVRQGRVSILSAKESYRVVIDPARQCVDVQATAQLRSDK
jgi:N-methylhydantoinase B